MNKNRQNIVITVGITFVVTVILCSLVFCAFNVNFSQDNAAKTLSDKVGRINGLLDKYAVTESDRDTAVENALYYYVASLGDEYAAYFGKDYYEEYLSNKAGNPSGIGVTVLYPENGIISDEGLFVFFVIGNSPAEAAGIKPADKIVAVDGTSLEGMSYYDSVNTILGEENTDVTLTVLRDGKKLDFTVTRSSFYRRSVDYRMLDGNIGFIRIYDFSTETTYSQFEKALNDLLSQGAAGFIFDMRNNPGGDYDTVVNMLNLLVPKDELVILTDKNGNETVNYSTGNRKTDLPSVVIINGESASAAELFASALRDLNKSPLVGSVSYGKGVGQTNFDLQDGTGLKFTTFYYMTKSRVNYDGIGLVPDYEINLSDEEEDYLYTFDETNDIQLKKALEVIKTMQ